MEPLGVGLKIEAAPDEGEPIGQDPLLRFK
jgi:hypothetical protein